MLKISHNAQKGWKIVNIIKTAQKDSKYLKTEQNDQKAQKSSKGVQIT